MKITGVDFINAVCNKLKNENSKVELYDSTIMLEIRKLTWQEVSEISHLGKWSNDYYANVQAQGDKHLEYQKQAKKS